MNASQLLEMAKKASVNQDQEAKWEADNKMKRKIDLLAQPLLNSQVGPSRLIQAEAITADGNKCRGMPSPQEELGKNQCACCCQERHWKNECLQWARDSQKAPQARGRGQIVKGKYQSTCREAGPWDENIVSLAALEGCEED
jgi:hypothetical protein